MGVDLKLIGERYSLIVLIFFISYVLLQPPATVVLRKVGPRTFLPTITILWGATMICFGFVKQWYELLPLRIILGIFEAGFFPVSDLCHRPFNPLANFTLPLTQHHHHRAAPTSSHAGTRVTSSRSATQSSTSSAA